MPLQFLMKILRFENEDIGKINSIGNIQYLIISMPKCGTTTIKQGFERVKHDVIHTHTDETCYTSLSNGDILKAKRVGLKQLIEYRLKRNSEKVVIFSGYRDTISWYLSMANQFDIDLDKTLENDIVNNLRLVRPWQNHSPFIQFSIIHDITGINIFDFHFDKEKGFGVIEKENIILVIYKIEGLKNLENYIRERFIRDYALVEGRVASDIQYKRFINGFKVNSTELDEIINNKFMKYFYSEKQILHIKNKYVK